MFLPKSITLAGLTIEVIVAPTLFKDSSIGGHSDYANLRILIAGDIAPQQQQVTFLHEALHFILFVMGEAELRDNEKFVDLLAHFLHQLQTQEVL